MVAGDGRADEDGVDADVVVEVAHRLYRLRPAEFVAARTTEAGVLRRAGDARAARAVTALRRPGVSAGLVNAVVRERSELVGELRDVGRRLRAASGGDDADELRSVDRERRTTTRRCVDAAADVARTWGTPASASTLRDVEQTFWAALVDAGAFATVRAGALLTPLAPNGFGSVDVSGASAVPVVVEDDPPVPPRARRARAAKTPEPDVAEVPPADEPVDESALEEARAGVEAAERAVAAAEDVASEASRQAATAGQEVADLKDELAAVRRRLTEVEGELRDAGSAERRSAADLKAAEKARRTAGEALERAHRGLRALET